MDTHSIELPLPEAEALRRIVDRVLGGGDAVVSGGSGMRILLDAAAEALAERGCRVLRASASAAGGLSLSGLMAQVTQRPDIDGHDDEVLELGFQALTVPDADGGTIALLVEGGEMLQRTALRYLQFTCRSAPALRFVLAGQTGIPDLQDDEMAFLRTRLASSPVIALAAELPEAPLAVLDASAKEAHAADPVPLPPSRPHLVAPSPAPSSPLAPSARPGSSAPFPGPSEAPMLRPALSGPPSRPVGTARQGLSVAWIGVGLLMAASIAVGVLIGRYGWPGGSGAAPQAAMQPGTAPAAVQAIPYVAQGGIPDNGRVPSSAAPAPTSAPASAPVLDAPGRAANGAPAPSPEQPLPGLAAAAPADRGVPDGMVVKPPAPPQHTAAQPDPAPARPRVQTRQAEGRSREFNPFGRNPGAPRFTGRTNQAPDAREQGLPPSGQEALYLSPVPPSWQPTPPEPSPDRSGERRPIIGTYTTDPNGVRTFRSVP